MLQEKSGLIKEYQQLMNNLNVWLLSSIAVMKSRTNLPNKLVEMRTVCSEFDLFSRVEIPPKYDLKNKLSSMHSRLMVSHLIITILFTLIINERCLVNTSLFMLCIFNKLYNIYLDYYCVIKA